MREESNVVNRGQLCDGQDNDVVDALYCGSDTMIFVPMPACAESVPI